MKEQELQKKIRKYSLALEKGLVRPEGVEAVKAALIRAQAALEGVEARKAFEKKSGYFGHHYPCPHCGGYCFGDCRG